MKQKGHLNKQGNSAQSRDAAGQAINCAKRELTADEAARMRVVEMVPSGPQLS